MSGIASPSQLRMSFLRYALFIVPAILLLGTLSGRAANSGYSNDWFAALEKPAAMPPGWAFPVAWTTLYILIGLSLAMVLHARGALGRPTAVAFFLVQLALNYAWSPVFFGAHKVGAALVIVLAMIVLSAITALLFARIRRAAALLMLPYIAWLFFAAFLTWQIGILNPGAATLVPGQASADIPL